VEPVRKPWDQCYSVVWWGKTHFNSGSSVPTWTCNRTADLEPLLTLSGTITSHFIYRATTKCSWAFWRSKTVKTMHIDNTSHIALWLTMMHGQQSLTLRWCSFSRWGRDHVAFSASCKSSQYFVYDCLQPVTPQITQNTWPTIVDTHFEDVAGRVSQSFVPIQVARNYFMTFHNLSAVWSARTHYQQSLMLCWRSS